MNNEKGHKLVLYYYPHISGIGDRPLRYQV